MKKIISGLMLLFAALTLTSCIEMTSETELEFELLPKAVLTEAEAEEALQMNKILVKINGQEYTLEAAQKAGAEVEGLEYTLGYNTLLVTYKDVTIAFTYLVNAKLPSIVDTTWYSEHEYSESNPYVIDSAADLRGLAQLVNSGHALFEGKTVKLGADIDLAGYAWNPIGEGARKGSFANSPANTFQGIFDGQNHVIKNLNDGGYVAIKGASYTNSISDAPVYGYVYGLFGMINASDVEIKNIKLENVDINGISVVDGTVYVADSVAGIVGWSGAGSFTIENCEVSGSIKGFDAVGGIVGRVYNAGTRTIKNCTNKADILASAKSGAKCAGLVGFISSKATVKLNECANEGDLLGEATYKGDLYVRQVNSSDSTSFVYLNGKKATKSQSYTAPVSNDKDTYVSVEE